MIARTKYIRQVAFFTLMLISLATAANFYWNISINVFWSILFAVGGVAIEMFRVYMLVDIYNTRFRKQKTYIKQSLYITMAAMACVSTFFAGIVQIERKTVRERLSTAQISVLEKQIKRIENRDNAMTSRKRTALIRTMEKQTDKPWLVRSLALIADKDSNIDYKELANLKKELARQKIKSVDTKGGFRILAELLNRPDLTNIIMIIVLAFFSLMLEIGINKTTAGVFIANRTRGGKYRDGYNPRLKIAPNQITFDDMGDK